MFLRSLSSACSEPAHTAQAEDYLTALQAVLSATSNTNTMMWIGTMADCPVDLSKQGELLKHGPVIKRPGSVKSRKGRKWSSVKLTSSFYLILFQQSLVLCRTSRTGENTAEPDNPALFYCNHVRYGTLKGEQIKNLTIEI
jgi:hypothetical protein